MTNQGLTRLLRWLSVSVVVAVCGACGSSGSNGTAPPGDTGDALSSPAGSVTVVLSLVEGELRYDVWRDRTLVLDGGRLGLVTDAADLATKLEWASEPGPVERVDQDYTLTASRQSRVLSSAAQRSYFLRSADGGPSLEIQVRAWDQGAAFRYRIEGTGAQTVRSELTSFPVSVPADGGMQVVQRQTPGNPKSQEMYLNRGVLHYPAVGTKAPTSAGWAYPLLLRNTDAAGVDQWLLFSETLGGATWPHAHLAAEIPVTGEGEDRRATYTLAFPDDDDNGPGQGAPRQEGTWVSPWRWVAIRSSLPEIYASTAETDLAEPQRLDDTSWIVPGTAPFDYIKEDSLTTLPRFRQYMDVARELGWSYVLVDSDWELMTDEYGLPMILLGARNLLQRLVDEAAERGLRLFVWYDQRRFATAPATERIFSMLADIGVAGVKVDKWESEKQDSVARRESVLAAAAEHRLMVSLHNITLPRGMHRTWPHLVGYEGGVSSQVYRGTSASADRVPELHVTQALLRGVFGTFDFGGILFDEPRPQQNPRRTTPAHELALMITYQAGLRTMSDDEAGYSGLPQPVRDFLATVPAAWDESRLLAGAIGRYAVVARRSGEDWYVGGINGETTAVSPLTDTSDPVYEPPVGVSRIVTVDLAALGCAGARNTLYTDTDPAGHDGHAVEVGTVASDVAEVAMTAFGGFVLVAQDCVGG